jgi:geranylgeranyl diphosphate synthase type I
MTTQAPECRPDAQSAGGGEGAAHVLALARGAVDPVLREAVGTLPEPLRGMCEYHLGWQDAPGAAVRRRASRRGSGKAIRPALVLAAARAGGGGLEAVPGACAVELVHNFTLLHDDVMDRSPTRRHRPTVWSLFGAESAILAGDALHSLALRLLADDPAPAAREAGSRLATCVIELCDGQQADWAFEERCDVTLAQCLRMAEAKTGALLGAACAIGALYAGASAHRVTAMDRFGRQTGLAFQFIDDVIGIWGDPQLTGKPVGSDLLARKKSLPVVAALCSGTTAGERLAALYRSDRPLTPDEVERAAQAVDEAGGRDWALARAADHMAAAVAQLTEAVCDERDAGDLLALCELITRREF